MPPATTASTAACMPSPAMQPSDVGHDQELLITSGARSGFALSPARSVGASIHCMHSMYRAGEPTPLSMLRQPIHLAPGATPVALPAPSLPTKVPAVCVPWLSSSHGACESL